MAWTPEEPPVEAPSSPIISAESSAAPSSGWQVPSAPPAVTQEGGWELPGVAAAPVIAQAGYTLGGIGARFVAWLIDALLSSLVPGALLLLVFDWNGFFRTMFDQIRFDESGRVIPGSTYAYTIPITLDLVLVYLIFVAVQFLYFVGFWTSRWQATPGMIGLKMRVVDARTGETISLTQAVKRWFAMGWWLGILVVVPVLQAASSLAQFAVNVFLFFSIVTNDRKQGLHDRFAGSQVIRSITSGDGATFVGCVVYIALVILIVIVAGIAFFVIAGPTLIDQARDLPRYTR